MARMTLKATEKARLTLWLAGMGPAAWRLTQRQLAASASEALGFVVTVNIARSARVATVPKDAPEPEPVRAPWWRRLIDRLVAADAPLES